MLDIRHFPVTMPSKNDEYYGKTWDDLVKEKKIVKCKICSKWISSEWHSDHDFLDICALCFFKDNK